MPGEERKFRRRRIVAFMPTCRREREVAASQAFVVDDVPGVGVGVDSTRGVSPGLKKGIGVAVAAFAAGAVGVAVPSGVVDGGEAGGGGGVGVDGKTAAAAVVLVSDGGGSVGIPGVAEAVLAGRNGVAVGIGELASPVWVRSRIRKRSNKRIATINFIKS